MKHRIAQIVLAQILCIGGVLYLYYPLNNFIPDWDQWVYFLDTLNYNNAIDLITKFYSYNRVRKFFPGDTLVFRPLLFSLLGIEKGWFAADFFKWQLLSAAIHADQYDAIYPSLMVVQKIFSGLSVWRGFCCFNHDVACD